MEEALTPHEDRAWEILLRKARSRRDEENRAYAVVAAYKTAEGDFRRFARDVRSDLSGRVRLDRLAVALGLSTPALKQAIRTRNRAAHSGEDGQEDGIGQGDAEAAVLAFRDAVRNLNRLSVGANARRHDEPASVPAPRRRSSTATQPSTQIVEERIAPSSIRKRRTSTIR